MGWPKIEFVFEDDSKKRKATSARPVEILLILAYVVILQVYSFVTSPSIEGIIAIAIYSYFTLYNSLWKMRKDWMWLFVAGLILLSVIYGYYVLLSGAILYSIIVILNLLSVWWVLSNRHLFVEPKKGESALGSISEWIKLGLTFVGIIGAIFVWLSILGSSYLEFLILLVVIWPVFVWLILPRIYKKLK